MCVFIVCPCVFFFDSLLNQWRVPRVRVRTLVLALYLSRSRYRPPRAVPSCRVAHREPSTTVSGNRCWTHPPPRSPPRTVRGGLKLPRSRWPANQLSRSPRLGQAARPPLQSLGITEIPGHFKRNPTGGRIPERSEIPDGGERIPERSCGSTDLTHLARGMARGHRRCHED